MLAVVITAISLASCKKDYTCTCSTTVGGVTTSASTTIKDTKKKAKEACEKGTSTVAGITVTCAIS